MKFEVGKKYTVPFLSGVKPWECRLVHGFFGVLVQDGIMPHIAHVKALRNGNVKEVPPPVTFADLKVGEKFRYKGENTGFAGLSMKVSSVHGAIFRLPLEGPGTIGLLNVPLHDQEVERVA